ncbi:MAG: AMP-dependent synthetase/ligase [Promethearchaeota archaeon]
MTLEEHGTNKVIMRFDDPSNQIDLFEKSVAKFPNNKYIGEKDAEGIFQYATYKEVSARVDNLRAGLAKLDILKKGDRIGIISNNSLEWAVGSFAAYGLGCSWVPMYEKELLKMWKYVVQDSGLKILFVANKTIYQHVKGFVAEIDTLKKIFLMGSEEDSMQTLEDEGKKHPIPAHKPLKTDTAVLIYTSGTTGDPKGVLLSHGNVTNNAQSGMHCFPSFDDTTRVVSILPWAHSYAYTAEMTCITMLGASLGITSMEDLSADLKKVKPTFIVAVPRLFNKIYAGVINLMAETGGIKEKLFYAAVAAAKKKRETGKSGLKLKLLDTLVFSKIREKLGGELQYSLTASAKNDTEIANFFFDIGMPVFDAYGMTETSPAISISCPSAYKIGSIGKPIEKVKVVIDSSVVEDGAKDGEIIAYGPNVMQGYLNKPEQTAAIMVEDENGVKGIRTGDRGWIDEEGFLYITGRIKTEFKLLNGKYVHPAEIEESIKLIPWVANAMIIGDGKSYNVALIVPDMDKAKQYGEEKNITVPPKDLIQMPEVQKLISAEIQAHLKKDFGSYEIPKRFHFIAEDFTLENKMLTQTFKLKRRNVLEKYGASIEALYDAK